MKIARGLTLIRFVIAGIGRQQVPVRAARTISVAVRARRSGDGQPGTVGDRSLQTATTFPERRAVQAYFRHVDRLQEYCQQDRERAQAVTVGHGRLSRQSRQQPITTS